MSAALFYVDALPGAEGVVVVDGDEGFHAVNVRRIRVGEEIDLSDGAGSLAHCVVTDTAKGRMSARVREVVVVAPPAPAVTVVQALPKSGRSELAVELATEAGADRGGDFRPHRGWGAGGTVGPDCAAHLDGGGRRARRDRRADLALGAVARLPDSGLGAECRGGQFR